MTAAVPPPPPPRPVGYGQRRPVDHTALAGPSTRGPKIVFTVGVVLLVAAIALAVVVAVSFVRLLPTGILTGSGPGPAVVAVVPAPGTGELWVSEPSGYALYLVETGGANLVGPIQVSGPDGSPVTVSAAAVHMESNWGNVRAETVAAFRADAPGEYQITVPDAGGTAAIYVAPDESLDSFLGGIFGTVAGMLAVVALGLVGFGMTLGGAIAWYSRSRRR